MIKTRFWVAGIGLALLLCAGAALWLNGRPAAGKIANVYQDGVCIYSFDLAGLTETKRYVLEGDAGVNMIEVGPEGIRIPEADCPDQVCVQAGWLLDSATPIVCLPHKLVIRLEGSAAAGTIDGVSK